MHTSELRDGPRIAATISFVCDDGYGCPVFGDSAVYGRRDTLTSRGVLELNDSVAGVCKLSPKARSSLRRMEHQAESFFAADDIPSFLLTIVVMTSIIEL
jgi:hypothetical protein